ncbi:ThuA domain-containing protein [Flavivirga jejuensis]|uniref:ThuA domain-containing protein n=1 Tax=Flavivirga jejuensis TaxID=870487 RepID=A0ABT8WIM4_9FLAO|nr:ThuA domain-containing protein [Flavivirga jejuensis]MDO5973011.1 ThuA domain-containing protein [Flavivirga jejuensis]
MKKAISLNKLFVLALFILCNTVYAQEAEVSSVIVFSKTAAYRHQSIEIGLEALKKLGIDNNFLVDATEDADTLIKNLNNYKVVVFLSTSGDIFNENQQKAFKKYIENGGGFVGIHAATDTEYDWPWYGKLIGAYFAGHPKQQDAVINIVNHDHKATSFLGDTWHKFDEWYNYKQIRSNINVLMTLDETSYSGGKNGENHPISWFHEHEGGRVFHTGLGHTKESYTDETFLKHILGGILYTMKKD